MLDQIMSNYIQPIVLIIGMIEFIKNVREKGKLTPSMVMQVVFCFIASALVVLQGWQDGFTAALVALIVYKWLLLISLVTLFYDLVVKKIKEAGGNVKGE